MYQLQLVEDSKFNDVHYLQVMYTFNVIPIKLPAKFCSIDELILNLNGSSENEG